MRFLVVYAHPFDKSFHSSLHRCVVDALRARHDVDDCDLYSERFDPVLGVDDFLVYNDPALNRLKVEREISRLQACDGLIFVFPTWFYGMPAILKGYFDRVWLPGVAFEIIDGRPRPMLGHIKCFGVVTTYGSSWFLNKVFLGDPGRKAFMRGLRSLVSPAARTFWLAQHGMDSIGPATRERFLEKVGRTIREL